MEFKKIVKNISEIDTVSTSLGGIDAHADIKQIKNIQANLKSDQNRKDLSRQIATSMTIQRRNEIDKIGEEVVIEGSKISQIFKSGSPTTIRAHVDSWLLFVLLTKLDSEKVLELAEWGMLEDLQIYIVESFAEQIEQDLNQTMTLEAITPGYWVLQQYGDNLPLNSDDSEDDEMHFPPGSFNIS